MPRESLIKHLPEHIVKGQVIVMSIYLVLMLAFFGFTWKAEARLGDTKEQAIARYGEPKKPSEHAGAQELYEGKAYLGPGWETMYCVDEDTFFTFKIVLFENKVEVMEIVKWKLSEEEVKGFLDKNAKGAGFVEKTRLPQEGGLGALVGGESIVYCEEESGRKAVYSPLESNLFITSDFAYKYGSEKREKKKEEEKSKTQENLKRY
jgi:hypothetical protein